MQNELVRDSAGTVMFNRACNDVMQSYDVIRCLWTS